MLTVLPPYQPLAKLTATFSVSLIILALVGCATGPTPADQARVRVIDTESHPALQDRLRAESAKLTELQRNLQDSIEQRNPLPPPIAPLEPAFNPLDAIDVTLVVNQADARNVLQAIARQAEMNLTLPSSLNQLPQLLTLELRDMPASKVLQVVLDELDMSAEVSANLIAVHDHEERIFNLDFLQVTSDASFNAGGDVFGASSLSDTGGGGGASGLTSNFTLQGRNTNTADPYDHIESMVAALIGMSNGEGIPAAGRVGYVLNRSTGTLFVRTRPSRMNTISRLVNQYQTVLQRQVLIEAQIIDVELNDQYRYGLNWSRLKNNIAALYGGGTINLGSVESTIPGAAGTPRTITIPGGSVGSVGDPSLGFVFGRDNHNIAIDLLRTFGTVHVLSNPSIRVKNTQPALVSVGSNERFIQQVSSTTSQAGGGQSTISADVVTGNLFDGVLLGVIPFIGDNGDIHLVINPMQTLVQPGSTTPRQIGGGDNALSISLPIVDFKGLTTSLSLRDGDLVILGGLISEAGSQRRDGVPPFSEIPGLDHVLGGHARTTRARELVIALRVTLL